MSLIKFADKILLEYCCYRIRKQQRCHCKRSTKLDGIDVFHLDSSQPEFALHEQNNCPLYRRFHMLENDSQRSSSRHNRLKTIFQKVSLDAK